MLKNINQLFNNYLKDSPNFDRVNWDVLPESTKFQLDVFPKEINRLGNFVSVRRLRKLKNKEKVTNHIIAIKKMMTGNKNFKIKFPILLKNQEYARLYALMTSEGSYRTEFSLHVPEIQFHQLLKECIKSLISEEASNWIISNYSKGIMRSRAPAIIRHILPFPRKIPQIILKDKELAREYLRVAFEAEGSPILDKKQYKRYIKISRYADITPFVLSEKLPLTKRIFIKELKEKYHRLFKKIKNHPPDLLLGEKILLEYHFGIHSKLQLEAIRNNKTDLRCGKTTARWVLFIYANNIDKFIKEISFLSNKKNSKLEKMKKFRGNNPQYSTLNIIRGLCSKKGYFHRKNFIQAMAKLGYKSPACYLWRYHKKGLIKRIGKGHYKILF